MTDTIFLSVAFGSRYIEQQTRLHKSILDFYPSIMHSGWTDIYPVGSLTHPQSLYGFKVHAIRHALNKGYKRIIWLDTACILQWPVDYWFELKQPVIAAKDDNKLVNHISGKALNYFGNPDIKGMNLVGGSVYVFDFDNPLCVTIFNEWAQAEKDGIFGSQKESAAGMINKHRHDESCLAYLMYKHGVEPMDCDKMRYNQDADSIVIKDHFK